MGRSERQLHRWEEQILLMGRNRAMGRKLRGRNIAMRKNFYADEEEHVVTEKYRVSSGVNNIDYEWIINFFCLNSR